MDDYLATFFTDGTHPDMKRYLYGPLADYSANAGKRHRPLICLLACEAVGGDPKLAWRSAAAIEHFHTAALIHDDIEDASQTRRGEPMPAHARGRGARDQRRRPRAVARHAAPSSTIRTSKTQCKLRVLAELVDMTTRTIEGQALDIGWARDDRFDLTVEDYLLMAQPQDRVTTRARCRSPSARSSAAARRRDRSRRCARSAWRRGSRSRSRTTCSTSSARARRRKKDFRSDITEGKRTLIAVHALRHSSEAGRLEQILGMRTADPALLAEAVGIMDRAGSIDYARDYARDIILAAKSELIAAVPPTKARDLLESMADFFIKRDK